MPWWLRAPPALPGDLSSIPSTQNRPITPAPDLTPSSGLQKLPFTCGRHTKETGWKLELKNYTNSNYCLFAVFLSSLSQILNNYKLGSGSLPRAPPSSCCPQESLGLHTWSKTSRMKSRKDRHFDSCFPS